MDLLHRVARALLERETLTGEEVLSLARGEDLPPRPTEGKLPPTGPTAPATVTEPRRATPGLLGGPEPAPA
jgi:cell division protease FtsH